MTQSGRELVEMSVMSLLMLQLSLCLLTVTQLTSAKSADDALLQQIAEKMIAEIKGKYLATTAPPTTTGELT